MAMALKCLRNHMQDIWLQGCSQKEMGLRIYRKSLKNEQDLRDVRGRGGLQSIVGGENSIHKGKEV